MATRRKRAVLIGAGLLGVAAIVAVATRDQWAWVFDGDPTNVEVSAPTITDVDASHERLFRIEPGAGSSVTYEVAEELAGRDSTATGSTDVLAGDLVVDERDASSSRIGEIVINVETFRSDSSLRDKRIRHDFLQSTAHPYARFRATEVSGLPGTATAEASELEITGELTVRDITKPVTFTGSAKLDDDRLTATARGTVLMSDYGIGPIHIGGLAHTADEVTFVLQVDAREVDPGAASTAELAVAPSRPEVADGDFSEVVQPILEAKCATCHAKGRAGANAVLIDTAGDAAEIAGGISLVTRSRYMPPWPASDASPAFEHDYSLDDDQIAALSAWADAGGGLDVAPSTRLVPQDPPFEPIERDQVMPQKGIYVGSLEKKDDYRCFVHEFTDEGDPGEWVVGMGFEPDQIDVVHHSIVYKAPASAKAEIESLDGADGRPGWECFGLANLRSEGVVTIGGWAPGQQPRTYPEGVGMYFEPGDILINQVHYHFDDETPPDQSVLVFDTMSDEEVAARATPMTQITGSTYLTPAEGPCTPAESGPLCDRETVLDDIAAKYGRFARGIPNSLIRACGGDITRFNQLDGTEFGSSCDMTARDVGTLHSVLGHMHEFGDSYRMTLNPGRPDERILLDIPHWSFDWQLYYVPTEEIMIEPGDVIRFECGWDRNNSAMPEPRYITWNEGTVDEMCFSSVSVVPHVDVSGRPNRFDR